MNIKKIALLSPLALPALLALAGDKPASAPGSAPAEMPMAQPLEQHALLKSWAGTWDGAVKMWMNPQQPPVEGKGVMVSKMVGGFWLTGEWTGEFMGQPFFGHEMCGYHINEKKFVCIWADSSADFSMTMKGERAADGKSITYFSRAPGMDGKTLADWKSVYEFGDHDRHVYTMWTRGKQDWVRVMEIIYTRRK